MTRDSIVDYYCRGSIGTSEKIRSITEPVDEYDQGIGSEITATGQTEFIK